MLSKHVDLLLIVVLFIGACSAHKSKGEHGSRNKVGYRGQRRPVDLSRCFQSGGYACYGPGKKAKCYQRHQSCDGHNYCPFGDDEYYCDVGIKVTKTVFSRRTATRTTTTTSTTTKGTTTTTTTTTSSMSTTLLTTTKTLAAVVPFKATSSALTTTFTVTTTFNALVQIPAGDPIAPGSIFCQDLMAAVAVAVAVNNAIVRIQNTVPLLSYTATAHVSCMPSATSYVML